MPGSTIHSSGYRDGPVSVPVTGNIFLTLAMKATSEVFDPPRIARDHELCKHVVYRIDQA